MSAANITPPDPQSALSSAASFLLSLNAGLGGDNAGADMFSKFLLQSQFTPPSPQHQASPQTQTSQQSSSQQNQSPVQTPDATTTTTDGSSNSATPVLPPLPILKKLVTTWRHLLERLQGQDHQNASGSKTHNAQTNASNGSTANSQSSSATGTGATDSTDGSGDSGSDPKTIADILKELQMLAMLIERQLHNLQNCTAGVATGTTAADGSASASSPTTPSASGDLASLVDPATAADPTDGTQAATDPSTATGASTGATAGTPTLAQALTDLLALVQLATKQLQAVQDPSSAAATTIASADSSASAALDPSTQLAAASVLPAGFPTDAQLNVDLKVLLTSLRASLTASKGSQASGNSSPAASSNSGSDSADGTPDTAPSADADSSNLSPAVPDATRDSWMQQQDFLGLFRTGDTSAPQGKSPVTFTPAVAANTTSDAAAAAGADAKNGASLDLDLNNQDNTQGNAASGGSLGNALDNSNLTAIANNTGPGSANPYSFASQLSEARATNGGTTGLPDVFEQVILQMNRNVKDGNDQMTIHLNPADLGRVDVSLNFSSDGKVQGTVVASNPATLHLLLKDVRGLERALQDAGVRADPGSLQFSLGNQSGNSSNQMPGNTPSGYTGNAAPDSIVPDTINDLSDVSADTTETYYLTPNRVNLRV